MCSYFGPDVVSVTDLLPQEKTTEGPQLLVTSKDRIQDGVQKRAVSIFALQIRQFVSPNRETYCFQPFRRDEFHLFTTV